MAKNLKDLIDIDLLAYFKSKLDLLFANKVDKENGKGLSTNDYTSEEKTKLANIATGAQVNTIEGVQIAGTSITPANKIVNIPVATQSAAGAMAAADKVKLDGVASGAQVNVIESVKRNGTALTITNKSVDVSVPTTVAELSDADDYATKDYVDTNGGKIDIIKVNGVAQEIAAADKSVDLDIDDIEWINLQLVTDYQPLSTVSKAREVYNTTKTTAEEAKGKIPVIKAKRGLTYFLYYLAYWNSHSDTIEAGTYAKYESIRDGEKCTIELYCPEDGTELDDFKLAGYAVELATSDDLDTKVDKVTGKGLSTEDYTTAEKSKLAGVAAGAQVNVIESVKRNGTALTITDKAVDISVPTTVAELADASNYATTTDLEGKVDKVDGKGLSTNDYTTAEKTKLSGIATGAQVNVIESVKVNGTALTITSKSVNVPVPTKTSDITNDSGYITIADVPEGAAATTTTPKMDGTATVGTETAFARGDHIHPHDTSKVDKVDGKGLSTNDYTTAEKNKLAGIAAGAQVNVVTDASSTGSGASQTMTVSKGSTNYTTYTKTALDSALGSKADASTVYTKTEIDQKLAGAMNYKGTKATVGDLPSSGNTQGDVWHVTADSSEWAWNGTSWEELGTLIDLSGYVEEDDIGIATTSQIDELFVTSGN